MRGRDIKSGRFAEIAVPIDPLREKLDELALRLTKQMLGEDETPLKDADVAMFKAVSNYYTGTRSRVPTQAQDDDGDGFSLMKERLNAGNHEAEADC